MDIQAETMAMAALSKANSNTGGGGGGICMVTITDEYVTTPSMSETITMVDPSYDEVAAAIRANKAMLLKAILTVDGTPVAGASATFATGYVGVSSIMFSGTVPSIARPDPDTAIPQLINIVYEVSSDGSITKTETAYSLQVRGS